MDVAAALCQPERDRGGDGGLADPALAHHHHDAGPRTFELVDEGVDAVDVGYVGLLDRRGGCGMAGDECTQGTDPREVAGDERHHGFGQGGERRGHLGQCGALAFGERLGDRVAGQRLLEQAVDDEALVGDAEPGQLSGGACCFEQ